MKSCAAISLPGTSMLLLALAACGGGGQAEPAPATPASEPSSPADSPEPAKKTDEPAAAPGGPASAAAPAGPDESDDSGPDTRTMETITAIVKAHRQEARACYEKALKQIPGLKGDVVIHFVLTPAGKVKLAELNTERSTIREASVSSCVIDVIRALSFPESSKGMESTVNYPFNFNP